jgi:hypothetical protein
MTTTGYRIEIGNTGQRATIMMFPQSRPDTLGYTGLFLFVDRQGKRPKIPPVQQRGKADKGCVKDSSQCCQLARAFVQHSYRCMPRAQAQHTVQWLVPIRAWAARLTKFV